VSVSSISQVRSMMAFMWGVNNRHSCLPKMMGAGRETNFRIIVSCLSTVPKRHSTSYPRLVMTTLLMYRPGTRAPAERRISSHIAFHYVLTLFIQHCPRCSPSPWSMKDACIYDTQQLSHPWRSVQSGLFAVQTESKALPCVDHFIACPPWPLQKLAQQLSSIITGRIAAVADPKPLTNPSKDGTLSLKLGPSNELTGERRDEEVISPSHLDISSQEESHHTRSIFSHRLLLSVPKMGRFSLHQAFSKPTPTQIS
jgi:hypothetical protein